MYWKTITCKVIHLCVQYAYAAIARNSRNFPITPKYLIAIKFEMDIKTIKSNEWVWDMSEYFLIPVPIKNTEYVRV